MGRRRLLLSEAKTQHNCSNIEARKYKVFVTRIRDLLLANIFNVLWFCSEFVTQKSKYSKGYRSCSDIIKN